MADEADIAYEIEEAERQAALRRRKPSLQATGFCWNCAEAVRQPRLFCDIECHRDHERRVLAKERAGQHGGN